MCIRDSTITVHSSDKQCEKAGKAVLDLNVPIKFSARILKVLLPRQTGTRGTTLSVTISPYGDVISKTNQSLNLRRIPSI